MIENRKRVLDMLAEGKITSDEAERLLYAIDRPPTPGERGEEQPRPAAKYLRVVVEPGVDKGENGGGERVNIRIPMALIRAGVKLAALVPADAATGINEALRSKGLDLDVRDLKTDELDKLIDALRDLEVDVDSPDERVRIYVE